MHRFPIYQVFRLLWQVGLAALAALVPGQAAAEKRVALIIGNAAYQNTVALRNPRNDAEDMASQLTGLGFRVLLGLDLDKAALDRKVAEFADALAGADVGVFFYGGHGLQVGGQNYLVPIDAKLLTAQSLDFETVRLDLVQRTMERDERPSRTNIIFLDACRDNPLARNLARALGTRSADISRGLAPVESGIGTLISFSTQPGSVALDGDGRNSPFAGALVKHIAGEGSITDVLINVRNDVVAATSQQQVPWEHSALRARFYFKGPGSATAPAAVSTKPTGPAATPAPATSAGAAPSYDQQAELDLWSTVEDGKNVALLQSYLDRYPKGRFAETARILIGLAKQDEEQTSGEQKSEQKVAVAQESAPDKVKVEEPRKDVDVGDKGAVETQTAGSERVAAAAAPAGVPTPQTGTGERDTLASDLQKELKRVGCYDGTVDGSWGDETRAALDAFAGETKLSLSSERPTEDALTVLRARKDRVCSLKSAARTEDAPERPKKATERAPSRQRQQTSAKSGAKKGRDCAPINGPYGYYANPWCK